MSKTISSPKVHTSKPAQSSKPARFMVESWKEMPLNVSPPTRQSVHQSKRLFSTTTKSSSEPSSSVLQSYSSSSASCPTSTPQNRNSNPTLPHLTPTSEIHIISVSAKQSTHRLAVALGQIVFSNASPYRLVIENALKKGDVLAVARVAGIMAAKRTAEWIPLCHSGIGVEGIRVVVEVVGSDEVVACEGVQKERSSQHGLNKVEDALEREGKHGPHEKGIGTFGGIRIEATVECTGKTGVEMEALTAVVGAGLTIVDMCKGVDKGLRMEGIRVVRKEGGRSGTWVAEDSVH